MVLNQSVGVFALGFFLIYIRSTDGLKCFDIL